MTQIAFSHTYSFAYFTKRDPFQRLDEYICDITARIDANRFNSIILNVVENDLAFYINMFGLLTKDVLLW